MVSAIPLDTPDGKGGMMNELTWRKRKLSKTEWGEAVRTIRSQFPESPEEWVLEAVRSIADMWGLDYTGVEKEEA